MLLFSRYAIALVAVALLGLYAAGIDVRRLPAPPGAVTFLDRTGAPLGTVLASDSTHAVAVPLGRVSRLFLQAILAAEDARFESHGAVDPRSLVRAVRDYAIFGQPRSGASTISMQLARLLRPEPSTLRGKIAQIAEAERISIRSPRDAVLEAYVNRVPMGGNVYGVEAAARTYFGEPAADLDLAQASLLAAIPNDPVHLTPDVDARGLRERQRYVLDRMVALGDVTRGQAAGALAETLRARRHDAGIADAAHALFFLYPRVGGSGRVRTTLDRDLQRFVQAQTQEVVDALSSFHVTDAAALVVDNRTGDVLAYVGSPDYFSDAVLGRNDGVQALRQPGSSLKPFTYELALERGTIRSTSILPDVPATYAIPGGKLYQPADYSGRFSGPVRVRYALANSLNLPAVHVLSELGVDPLLDRLHELGFTHLDKPAAFYGLGLTLGGGEVTLWEMARAYVAVARRGSAIPLRLVDDGSAPATTRVGDAATWSLIADMLADPHARERSFGLHSVLDLPFDAAVKTGTSSDFRDTWTVGFSRDYTVAVWVGNFDGSAMRGISGVTGAGPLWNRIMLHLHEANEPAPFDPPYQFVRTSICATTGHAPERTCPAVVREWVRRADLADVRRPLTPRLGHEYDAWLALQPAARKGGTLRIVFPHDGDVFIRNAVANSLQAKEQQIALRATGGRGTIRWSVDGHAIEGDSDGVAFMPLRLGSWTIVASDGRAGDRVTVRVEPAPLLDRPGFTRRP